MKIWVAVFFTASLLAAASGISCAQTPPASPTAPKPTPLVPPTDYPGESVVFDQLTRIYTYASDGTGTREVTGVIEVRNQAGVKALSVLPFDFASSAEHVEIDYVRVRHADGSIVTTSAADAQEVPTEVTREAPFYSDLKQEQIPVRSLQPGDLLEYKIRIVRTKPEVAVRGDLNPISEDLLIEVRRWLVQPARGQRRLGAGDSFFGSFVSIFVNPRIEDSERQVRFVSQPFVLGVPPPAPKPSPGRSRR
jgi:hypothetical protein